MRNKDTILLEQAYESVYNQRLIKESLSEDEANDLILRFHMLPTDPDPKKDQKKQAFEKLKGLEGKEVSLSRATKHKLSTGYGRDTGSATRPGSGGSVAHTEFEMEDEEVASGIVQAVKIAQGQDDYTKNGNLVLTIKGVDHNVSQGATVKVHFLEDSPPEVLAKAGESFRTLGV